MSTAAPPAAASAPAAAPVAAPASSPAGEPTAPQAAAKPEAQPRTIKPIPPSRLPGVMEDGPEDASSPEAQAARARDAQGRFVAAGEPKGGETGVVQKPQPRALDAAEGEPKIPEPPGESKPFMFAGRPFKSQADAEHYVKSMEGRYKPVQEAATRHEAQLVKAAESARGWHAEAPRLQAEIARLQSGTQAPPQTETQATPETAKGIDWALYADIAKVANEAGEPWKAQQWLQEQTDALRAADSKRLEAEIQRLRDEAIENPRREAEEQAQLAQTADSLVNSMAAHTNPDGTPAFPEFRDGKAREIGELWRSLDLDPRIALTPGGAVAAVALYRMARSMNAAPPPALAPPVPSDPAASAAAEFEGGRPLVPAAGSRRELDPSVARLVAGLKNTQLIRPGLGFEQ